MFDALMGAQWKAFYLRYIPASQRSSTGTNRNVTRLQSRGNDLYENWQLIPHRQCSIKNSSYTSDVSYYVFLRFDSHFYWTRFKIISVNLHITLFLILIFQKRRLSLSWIEASHSIWQKKPQLMTMHLIYILANMSSNFVVWATTLSSLTGCTKTKPTYSFVDVLPQSFERIEFHIPTDDFCPVGSSTQFNACSTRAITVGAGSFLPLAASLAIASSTSIWRYSNRLPTSCASCNASGLLPLKKQRGKMNPIS